MAKRKVKIDWLNHSLEFFVVIIGILIAFQLNTCASKKGQRQTINTHLNQLLEETKINKQSIETAITFGEQQDQKLDSLLRFLADEKNHPKANALALELLNLGGVYLRKNAYNTLIESGDIRFISDFSVKKKIINLYEYYTWVEAFNTISTDLYATDYYPSLKTNFDLRFGKLQDKSVYQSKLFQNIIAAYQRTSRNRIQKYRDCLEVVKEYLEENTAY